jgi:histidine triad (HIT) family protein
MPTIFTRIIGGEIPGTFVWRDEQCVVFLSINPMAHGHCLVVPIQEVDHWVDADSDLIAHLFEVTRVIGVALKEAFGCERVGVIIAGYEVPHTHIHVMPRQRLIETQLMMPPRQSVAHCETLVVLRSVDLDHCQQKISRVITC